jgi:hypothetical protein
MTGFVNLDQSGPLTPSSQDIKISSKRGVIRRRRSGLISDEEIRNGKLVSFLLFDKLI